MGDHVAVGDILFNYETDKASFECESTAGGELLEIFFQNGDEVPCLANVCAIGTKGEDCSSLRPAAAGNAAPEVPHSPHTLRNDLADIGEGHVLKRAFPEDLWSLPFSTRTRRAWRRFPERSRSWRSRPLFRQQGGKPLQLRAKLLHKSGGGGAVHSEGRDENGFLVSADGRTYAGKRLVIA